MSISAPPPHHVHITEREVAHRWPDGRSDDAKWEDCAFVTAVEFERATHDPSVPATHTEAEALRAEAGLGPEGGATIDQVRTGLQRRYGHAGTRVQGFASLWAALQPGIAACVQGSYAAFPLGHRLRRFDPGFAGQHQTIVFRLDDVPHVWWCDPLAPEGTYQGEWISQSELSAYVNAWPGAGHTFAPLYAALPDTATEDPMANVLPFGPARVHVSGINVFTEPRLSLTPVAQGGPFLYQTGDTDVTVIGQATGDAYQGDTTWLCYLSAKGGPIFFPKASAGTITPLTPGGITQAEYDAAVRAARASGIHDAAAAAAAVK